MASITKTKSGKWKARIRCNEQNMDVSKTFETRAGAAAWARRMLRDIEEDRIHGHRQAALRHWTVAQMCDEYLEAWRGRDKDRQARIGWWKRKLGTRRVLEVDPPVIRDALKDYMAEPVTRRGKPTGKKKGNPSFNRQSSALSAVFAWAVEHTDLRESPWPNKKLRYRPEKKSPPRFLTQAECDALLKACKTSNWDRLYLLVLMAIHTGARRGELKRLKWSDINWKQATAYVGERKSGQPHVLVLQPQIVAELRRFEPSNGPVVSIRQIDELVFRGQRPLTPRAFEPEWNRAKKRSGIKPLRFHDLRHTHASLIAAKGASLLQIAESLGVSLQSVGIYAHLCVKDRVKVDLS